MRKQRSVILKSYIKDLFRHVIIYSFISFLMIIAVDPYLHARWLYFFFFLSLPLWRGLAVALWRSHGQHL